MRKEFVKAVQKGQFEITEEGELYLPRQKVLIGGRFGTEVVRNGEVIMPYEETPNLIVDEGLNHILNGILHAETQITTWYVGIYQTAIAPSAAWTGANIESNANESTAYSETVRQTYVEAESTAESTTNSASKATFTMNATVTINGAFLISTSTREDTAGTLFAASQFSTGRDLVNLDELLVTYTVNATSS